MVRREDISSRLQRIQEENSPTIPSAVASVVAAPHINGLAVEMYNDPLLVAIALHFEEDEHESAVGHLNGDDHSSDSEPETPANAQAAPVAHAEPITLHETPRRPARPPRALRHSPNEVGELPKRSGQKGTRRVRRAENDLSLLRSAAGVGERDDGTSTRTFEEITIKKAEKSLFADLFDGSETSENNRKLWDQFLLLSEEKQQRVLQKLDSAGKHRGTARNNHATKEKSDFAAIDRRLRQMLLRQKPPPAMVRQVEDVVISAFAREPHSVQLYRKLDAFRRSIYHSVCQYAKLTSKTLNKRGGAVTHNALHADVEVRNQREEFTRPDVMLSDYLEKSREDCQA